MGESNPRRVIRPEPRPLSYPLPEFRRRRPRSYEEWKALRRWDRLPSNERAVAGYLLHLARERAELTQQELADRLGCSQQAVSQAERWDANPTIAFINAWVRAAGGDLIVDLS